MSHSGFNVPMNAVAALGCGTDQKAGLDGFGLISKSLTHASHYFLLLLRRLSHQQSPGPGDFDLVEVSADFLAVLFQHADLVSKEFGWAKGIPLIGVPCDNPEHELLTGTADHQRRSRLLKRLPGTSRALETIELAVKVHGVLAPKPF